VEAAQAKMTGVKETVYEPIAANVAVYERLYSVYKLLHDGFGGVESSMALGGVMKELIPIRNDARK
jgi:L-ribulokinase